MVDDPELALARPSSDPDDPESTELPTEGDLEAPGGEETDPD